MKKRIAALFVALASALSVLVACKDQDSPTVDDSTTQLDAQASEIAEIDSYVANLANAHSFDGASFTYIGRDDSNFPTMEEETGSILSDALYFRQKELEEKFDIKWINKKTRYGDDTQELVIQSVMADSSEYNLVYGSMLTVGQPLLLHDAIMSVDSFQHLDISKNWWAESIDEVFSIKEKLFFLTGPIVTNHYSDTSCLLFNKELVKQYGLPDLYSLVTEGEWTIDKMFELGSYVPAKHGDSPLYRYGDPNGIEWIFSSGMRIINFRDDGTPYVDSEPSEKLLLLADKMSSAFGDSNVTCALNYTPSGYKESSVEKYGVSQLEDMFVEDKVLFWFTETGNISDIRETGTEFGVLPMPKWDKEQKQYFSYASQWGGAAVYVPKNISDTEMTDVIIEATAALSQKYVKPAFYDKALKTGSTYDAPSRGMLDIVLSTKAYDIVDIFSGGDMNSWGALMNLLDRSISEDDSRLIDEYSSNVMVITRNIGNILRIISKDDDKN